MSEPVRATQRLFQAYFLSIVLKFSTHLGFLTHVVIHNAHELNDANNHLFLNHFGCGKNLNDQW